MATMDTEAAPIASPCIGVCTLDDDDVCVGCYRSIDEISGWSTAGDDEKRAIVDRAAARGRILRRA